MTRHPLSHVHQSDQDWQRWGEQDPYFGVITEERFRRRNLTPAALDEFFETGRQHARRVLGVCRQRLGRNFSPRRVLDFGCGVGRVLVGMAELFPAVVGVDVSPGMLAEAARHCSERQLSNVTLVPSDDQLSAVEGSFDLIHSVLVFQHIHPERGRHLIACLLERLNPGGVAALHVTYAKERFAENFGRPPDEPGAAPGASRFWPFSRRPAAAGQPGIEAGQDPGMAMHAYALNDLFFCAQRLGIKRSFVEMTDHGGEWGVLLYLQRASR